MVVLLLKKGSITAFERIGHFNIFYTNGLRKLAGGRDERGSLYVSIEKFGPIQ